MYPRPLLRHVVCHATQDHDILLEQYRSNLKTVMETDSDDTSSDNAADTKIAVEVTFK